MEEEVENVKFQQVLTRFYFLCAATRSIDPYKLALHSFPTFQVFRHSWSFTRVQPGQPGHSGHLSHQGSTVSSNNKTLDTGLL